MAQELFEISEVQSVGVMELRVPPDMDPLAIDEMMESVVSALDNRATRAWVVDLTRVEYMNSSGLGMLCNIRNKVRKSKGKLALCGLSPQMVELFQSCCLERLFVIAKTRAEAISAVM
jgi:anti-sigma B factor antagonist